MRAVIMTLGTRGDVQPYVALGQELIKRGHEAVICTGESFKSFIEEYGITFAKAESDLMALLKTPEGQAVFNSAGKNIIKTLKYVKEVVNPAFRKSLDDFWEAAREADVIIYHPKAFGAADMAQLLGIPCISMPPVPITYPITEFPNLAVNPSGDWGKVLNKLSYKFIEKADASNIKEINDFRNKTLHLPKRKAGEFAYKKDGKNIPIIYPISPALFSDVKSWEDKVFLSGFLFLNTKKQELDNKIQNFLTDGKKPIIISFSSMPLKEPEVFKEKLIEALKLTNNRAIILTGTSGMHFSGGHDVLAAEQAPHALLFPKAKGIVHHGGAGTMAAALGSGVPQLIIPFSADQPFWANRLYKMGYALKPLRERSCSVQALVLAFQKMDDAAIVGNALAIKGIIEKENGVKSAVDYIEKVLSD